MILFNMRLKQLFSLMVCWFAFAKANSQEIQIDSLESHMLNQVVLTATRTARQLSSLPLPVTLISKEQILKTGVVRLQEILEEQTGIIVTTDESGFEGIQIQGISSEYVLILIDGVPLVGRSAGNFDLSRLTVGNIKQIEVVKGPSSSLYGSEALGGVINIITEKPKNNRMDGNASYRIGSFVQQDINLDLKQGFDKLRYGLFFNRFSSNGYDLDDSAAGPTVSPFENYTANGRLYYDFTDKLALFASTRYYNQVQEADFSFNNNRFVGDTREDEWNLHLKLDQEWNDYLDLEYELYYTNYKADEFIQDPISTDVLSDSNFDQALVRPEVRLNYDLVKAGKITTGVGLQVDQLDRTSFDNLVRFDSQYIYSQWDVNILQRLNAIIGLRYDNHSEYNDQISPKLALRYELNDSWALKGSVGYGFKAPDFRQLYFDFTNATVGYTVLGYNVAVEKLQQLERQGQLIDILIPTNSLNEPLAPESSIGTNLGVVYRKNDWSFDLNFFRNDFTNLIDTRIIARKTNGQNVFSYVNFDEIYTTGLELNAQWKINPQLQIQTGYQLLYAFDKAKEDLVNAGEVFAREPENNTTVQVNRSDYFGLINRSRHHANFKVFYEIPSWEASMNLRVIYRSKYALFDSNGNDLVDRYDSSFIDGFATANITATKQLFKDFTATAGAVNFLNHTDDNLTNLPGIQGFFRLNYKF